MDILINSRPGVLLGVGRVGWGGGGEVRDGHPLLARRARHGETARGSFLVTLQLEHGK